MILSKNGVKAGKDFERMVTPSRMRASINRYELKPYAVRIEISRKFKFFRDIVRKLRGAVYAKVRAQDARKPRVVLDWNPLLI